MVIIGWLFLAIPFIVVTIWMIESLGVKAALICWGLCGSMIGFIMLGVYFITGSLAS